LLLILNLPLVGLWIRLLSVPYRILFPAILVFISIGVYSLHQESFDLLLAIGFGLVGYIFIKLRCEPAPLLLGLILSPLVENNLRRSMLLSRGDPTVFFTRPLSLAFMLLTLIFLLLVIMPAIRRRFARGNRE